MAFTSNWPQYTAMPSDNMTHFTSCTSIVSFKVYFCFYVKGAYQLSRGGIIRRSLLKINVWARVWHAVLSSAYVFTHVWALRLLVNPFIQTFPALRLALIHSRNACLSYLHWWCHFENACVSSAASYTGFATSSRQLPTLAKSLSSHATLARSRSRPRLTRTPE